MTETAFALSLGNGGILMFVQRTRFVGIVLVFVSAICVSAFGAEAGFKPIFDGKTLDGWKASDMKFWSVEEGAITGESTEQNVVKVNQFIVWQLGEVDDFELKLKYRISGTDRANSGVQIRSAVAPEGWVGGYQADIDRSGRFTGIVYEERRSRGIMAQRGQRSVFGPDGEKSTKAIGDGAELGAVVKKDGWNDYHIIARGPHIELKINGRTMSEVFDSDKKKRELSGVLALQLHVGPPMKVQFKDIRLKRLAMEGRKKVVLVAGRKSHGFSGHEHNAGCLLLAKLLNECMPNMHATVYTDGWPQDPTAFDNADGITVFCDGGGGHVVMRHLEEMDAMAKDGMGIAFLHYGVELPKGKPGDYALDWVGGYFETFWSVNPHWTAEFKKLPNHPITRGIKPFFMDDEWYYHMRFRENMQGVTPILSAVPPESTRQRPDGAHSGNPTVRARKGMAEHVAWAYERPDGGRGFGFTGGHWHWSWASDDFRNVVLNALVWICGEEVPEGGVPSRRPSLEELLANQDYDLPGNWNQRKAKVLADIEAWNSN